MRRPTADERNRDVGPTMPTTAGASRVSSVDVTAGADGGFADAPPPDLEAVATRELRACSPRIDQQIADVLEDEVIEPGLRNAIKYHLGWLDERFEVPIASAPRAGGKKLRATLAVLAYRAATSSAAKRAGHDDENIEPVVPFAAAVELIHNWSLVHDDIEDGDRTRRGRPALWTIFGEAQAINVGDCLFALAFCCLGRLHDHGVAEHHVSALASELARTSVDLTVGQMRDLTYETTNDIDSDRYLEMIEGKTAALIRCATWGGALLGSGDEAGAQRFGEFGRRLGLAFQMRDDILGIWGTDTETGKPTGGDIRRRKKSLPVVLAFERAVTGDAERLRRLYAQDRPISPDDQHRIRDILDRCGAKALAQEQAEQHRVAAITVLAEAATAEGCSPSSRPFTALQALADFVAHRSH